MTAGCGRPGCTYPSKPLLALTLTHGPETDEYVEVVSHLDVHIHSLDEVELIAATFDKVMRHLGEQVLAHTTRN